MNITGSCCHLQFLWFIQQFECLSPQEETLPPADHTETLKNQENRGQIQDKEAEWMWCWRCGGGSVSQRRRCRRTQFQQDSPHTLLLCYSLRRRWMFLCYCDRHGNHHQNNTDSRTDHSIQAHIHSYVLFFWFLCKSLLHQHLLSSRPPSNSDQSNHLYTAAEAASQTCLDGQDTADLLSHVSPSCCCQTVWVVRWPCLCPEWVHRNLMETRRHETASLSSDGWFQLKFWHHLHFYSHVVSHVWSNNPDVPVEVMSHELNPHLHFLRPGSNLCSPPWSNLEEETQSLWFSIQHESSWCSAWSSVPQELDWSRCGIYVVCCVYVPEVTKS